MTPAIDLLMQEHRIIEHVLEALDRCAGAAAEGRPIERALIGDFGDFFANFADRLHHGKEEARLFAAMLDHGFSREDGPVGMMLLEHDEGRRHVDALRRLSHGGGALTSDERQAFIDHARDFSSLLRDHILKEDEVLYPMAVHALSAGEWDDLLGAFARFDAETGGDVEGQRLRSLAAELAGWQPD
jgi:hemerythrin-like domain-containing protein